MLSHFFFRWMCNYHVGNSSTVQSRLFHRSHSDSNQYQCGCVTVAIALLCPLPIGVWIVIDFLHSRSWTPKLHTNVRLHCYCNGPSSQRVSIKGGFFVSLVRNQSEPFSGEFSRFLSKASHKLLNKIYGSSEDCSDARTSSGRPLGMRGWSCAAIVQTESMG